MVKLTLLQGYVCGMLSIRLFIYALSYSFQDGLTPLHYAARSGHEAVVDLLVARGAPISAKTKVI